MTGNFWLDWATLAVSLNNTILMLWLGLTVLLNAEKRRWGIWFTSGALILGSIFFFSHTAILGLGLNLASEGLDFWWHVGWIPVILLPFGWYAVTLWYNGFWDRPTSDLQIRQRLWFYFATGLTLALIVFLLFANPLPSFAEISNLQLTSSLTLAGIPILIPLYVIDIMLCVVLSLDALRRPAPSPRIMGDIARRRARPWFVTTAIVLLIVGMLVTWVIVWVTSNAERGFALDNGMIFAVGVFDLVIASLIAVSIFCVGQAIALYQVFTGKVLPRRGLLRHWYNAVILAIGYGIVTGWSIAAQLRPTYNILLTTGLFTIFYALLGWRTYVERDRFVRDLRPFVASQRLYDQLLTATPSEVDVATPFRALCRDLLNARSAFLSAVGPLAPLVPPLAYPENATTSISIDLKKFDSPQTMCVQIDATHWAVPLWSERGLIGVLTLEEKIGGEMYAQEEIEIARASGERLIDTCASAELARRMIALQRQRLVETQLLDRQARRVLHDEILPQLHTAMLTLGDANPQAIELLTSTHRQLSNLLREMPLVAPEVARLGLIGALQRTVDEEWKASFDSVSWQIDPEAKRQAQSIQPLTAETVFYATREAIRNAAQHARAEKSDRALNLRIEITRGLCIIIEDDGVGVQANPLAQKNGHGLALHSTMLAVVGGTLSLERRPSGGTRVTISIPPG